MTKVAHKYGMHCSMTVSKVSILSPVGHSPKQ